MYKIGVFGSLHKLKDPTDLKVFYDSMRDYQVDIIWEKDFLIGLKEKFDFDIKDKNIFEDKREIEQIDFALSLGGDGTFLRVGRLVKEYEKPIWGINIGRLGFLTDTDIIGASKLLPKLFDDKYKIEKRTMLNVVVDGICQGQVVNELAIMKRETGSMISIETYLNDEFLANYEADGLLVATPTGSTAYSLSAGGPILMPSSEAIVLTPIAPHTLTMRPLIASDNSRIRMTPNSRKDSFLISLDGQTFIAPNRSNIEVSKDEHKLNILHIGNRSFVDNIREKLMWGQSNTPRL